MKKITLKDLKDSAIYLTPHLPILLTKRYKFSLLGALGAISLFTLIVWAILIDILAVTPLKDYVFVVDKTEIVEQASKINELEKKIRFLRYEIENFSSKEKKLKYALILGIQDSTIADDSVARGKLYDTLMQVKKTKQINKGSVLSGLFLFAERIFSKLMHNEGPVFRKPVNGIVLNEFNPSRGHMGMDFVAKSGSPVFASLNGLVIFADYTGEDGNILILQHSSGYVSVYKHLSAILKKQRDNVEQGEIIALSGNSGYNTSGSHLHFEIWKDGKAVNPKDFLINN